MLRFKRRPKSTDLVSTVSAQNAADPVHSSSQDNAVSENTQTSVNQHTTQNNSKSLWLTFWCQLGRLSKLLAVFAFVGGLSVLFEEYKIDFDPYLFLVFFYISVSVLFPEDSSIIKEVIKIFKNDEKK